MNHCSLSVYITAKAEDNSVFRAHMSQIVYKFINHSAGDITNFSTHNRAHSNIR